MVDELGYLGIGPAADAILDGTYVPPQNLADKMVGILDSLEYSQSIHMKRQPTPITCTEHGSVLKKEKERTSSSPSGLHMGH